MTTYTLLIYPRLEDVAVASRYDLSRWWRFLRSPETPYEEEVMAHIHAHFQEEKGMSPDISKLLDKRVPLEADYDSGAKWRTDH